MKSAQDSYPEDALLGSLSAEACWRDVKRTGSSKTGAHREWVALHRAPV